MLTPRLASLLCSTSGSALSGGERHRDGVNKPRAKGEWRARYHDNIVVLRPRFLHLALCSSPKCGEPKVKDTSECFSSLCAMRAYVSLKETFFASKWYACGVFFVILHDINNY